VALAALAALPSARAAAPIGPMITARPVVLGTPAAGKRLTGLSGTWTGTGTVSYRFEWFRCTAAGTACLPVQGATAPTYTVVARDVGKTIGFAVYATDATGTAAAYAALVGPVAAARPPLENTLQPLISGLPLVGHTLRVSAGLWSPTVHRFTYAWERCNPNGRICAAIPGATTHSYVVESADIGHALVALVQAANGSTLQETFSTATAAVTSDSAHGPVELIPPQAVGALTAGSQLIGSVGRWQGVGPLHFAFQWYVCDLLGGNCAAVKGATAATYTLAPSDVGDTIGLTVNATDLTGTVSADASVVGEVAASGSTLTASTAPVISGSAVLGGTLSTTTGTWSVAAVPTTVVWLRCSVQGRDCSLIPGASATIYTPTAADVGHTLIAEATASSQGATQASFSAVSATIT
jgi:fibronectin-binding autotransporter adhesin